MKKLLTGQILFSLALVIVFLLLIITDSVYNYQARLVPMIVAVPSFLLAMAQFLIEVRNASQRKDAVPTNLITEKQAVLPPIAAADAKTNLSSAPAVVPESVLAFAAAELANSPTVTRTATGKVIPNLESSILAAETVKPERAGETDQAAPARWTTELVAVGWLVGLVLLIAFFGFFVGLPVFVFALLKFHGRESWKFSILYTVVFWVLVYGLFVVLMKSQLYPGVVFDRLGL